jgi:hypothetical protein
MTKETSAAGWVVQLTIPGVALPDSERVGAAKTPVKPKERGTQLERTVFAALVLAGEPVNNLKPPGLMGVSPGECPMRAPSRSCFRL